MLILKTVFTVRHGREGQKNKNNTKMSQLTEVHGMQTLDMKFKLHTVFSLIIYDLCSVTSV